jgi:O-antigen/teichoic acid export membrane protein
MSKVLHLIRRWRYGTQSGGRIQPIAERGRILNDREMMGIRRAFLWASAGRYIVMAINLVTTVIMARLLAPGEYGISALGTAIFAIAEAMRALGGGAYLIQQKELAAEHVRTTFTVSLIVTLVLTTILALLAGPLTRYFNTPDLERYLLVTALGYLMGPFVYPIFALMSRQMAFETIALISVVAASANAIASICLAILGYSYMSFAWASVISAAAGMYLCFHFWRDWSIFRPLLNEWRSVIAFGAYDSMTAVLSQIGESLPYLIFGRILNAEAVGLCQRAVLLCLFPERVILAGVSAVALPVFSKQVREGRGLKDGYLHAIELITAVQWPALILLVLLANPIVSILLGRQWLEVVSLIQILGIGLLFSFPVGLHYPTLVAVGAIRYMPPLVVLQSIVSIALLSFAAKRGLHAAALSTLLIVPFNVLLTLLLVRHFVDFRWSEFAAATRKSAVLSVLSMAGPLTIVIASGRHTDISNGAAIFAVLLCAIGWIGGLWLTRHPLLHELFRARDALLKTPIAARFFDVSAWLPGRWR